MRPLARRLLAAFVIATGLSTMLTAPGNAADAASGFFVFRTANGILPTWERAGLRLAAIAPASSTTSTTNANVTMRLPVVAAQGNTAFAAGGFRLTNVDTGDFVTCASPAVTPSLRVVECVLNDGTNVRMFTITSVGAASQINGTFTRTRVTRDMTMRIANRAVADQLNEALEVTVFSPSVNVATAGLTVAIAR